jgi:hypothetical protein
VTGCAGVACGGVVEPVHGLSVGPWNEVPIDIDRHLNWAVYLHSAVKYRKLTR